MVDAITTILAALGTLLAVLVSISPIPSLMRAWKSKELSEISHTYLLMANLNPLIWLQFALRTANIDILIPNLVTFSLSLIYVIVYHIVSKDYLLFGVKYISTICIITLFGISVLPIPYLGFLAVIANLLGFAAPLEQLGPVMIEKESRYIDINIIGASLCCAGVWLGFGIASSNLYILIPNAAGVLLCILQITMYFWARSYIPHCIGYPLVFIYKRLKQEPKTSAASSEVKVV